MSRRSSPVLMQKTQSPGSGLWKTELGVEGFCNVHQNWKAGCYQGSC